MTKKPRWTFSLVNEERKYQYVEDLKKFEEKLHEHGLLMYLIYGTLLGAIREHNFIAHDSDIDIAYLSKYIIKSEVYKERKELKQYFIKNKMLRTKNTIGLKVKYLTSNFDLWTSWIENNNLYLLPFNKICPSNIVLPFKENLFRGTIFNIPNQSEKLLDIIYINWKKPIPKTQPFRKLGQ